MGVFVSVVWPAVAVQQALHCHPVDPSLRLGCLCTGLAVESWTRACAVIGCSGHVHRYDCRL